MIACYDLGSAKMGYAPLGDHAPVELVGEPMTLGVDPARLDAVVAAAVELAVCGGATRAAIEHTAKLYPPRLQIPPGSSDAQTAKLIEAHRRATISMAEAHRICSLLQSKLSSALEAAGIETRTWARQSWAHRVVPHHQGGLTTAKGNDGLRALCAHGMWERLRDQHQRDAAGVGCMWIIAPPARPKRYRPSKRRAANAPEKPKPSPEAIRIKRRAAAREGMRRLRGDATEQERIAAGCVCVGKHVFGCPVGGRAARIADAVKKGPYLR